MRTGNENGQFAFRFLGAPCTPDVVQQNRRPTMVCSSPHLKPSSPTQDPRRRAAKQQGACPKEYRRIFSCKGCVKGWWVDVTALGILPSRHVGADPLIVA